MAQLTPQEKQLARELWLPLNYQGFEHFDVSTEGRVRNRITKKIATPFLHTDYHMSVALRPSKESGIGGTKRFRVSRLVFETHYRVKLPPRITPRHKNGNVEDNRLSNLLAPEGVEMPKDPITSVLVLPTVRPPEKATPALPAAQATGDQGPALTPRQIEYAKRYEAHLSRIRDAFDLLNVSAIIDELVQLRVIETDFVDALEGYPVEKTAALIYRLFTVILETK